jgi:hypothetical protein
MPLHVLDYSGPRTHMGQSGEASPSIRVGMICWGAIALAAGLFLLAGLLRGASFGLILAGVFILLSETFLAFYGLLGGLIDCHLVRPVWRGIIGVSLNLSALSPAVLFVVGFVWR